jgi:hypothetical protein
VEAARVRVRLLQELAATREALVATHLPFPSICHVAVAANAFRCVPAVWDYCGGLLPQRKRSGLIEGLDPDGGRIIIGYPSPFQRPRTVIAARLHD